MPILKKICIEIMFLMNICGVDFSALNKIIHRGTIKRKKVLLILRNQKR